jgi:hypothetical protein
MNDLPSIRLIHWDPISAEDFAALVRELGYRVNHASFTGAEFKLLREDPPEVIIIDLSRRPSSGRDIGIAIRTYTDTRRVSLIFTEGDPSKVETIRTLLPDAVYTTWDQIESSLESALANPPKDPIVPPSLMSGYSGTPLPKKLGIKANSIVALIDAPEKFEETLGSLPEGVEIRQRWDQNTDLTLWFIRSKEELEERLPNMVHAADQGSLWIIWPKKTSGMRSNLSQTDVRSTGLSMGLVDFKICSIDNTWSGLRFTYRKARSKKE